jgi:hypothetical protein
MIMIALRQAQGEDLIEPHSEPVEASKGTYSNSN